MTEQSGFWLDGTRIAVSVSIQFEAGGQPVSGAGGPITEPILPGFPDLGQCVRGQAPFGGELVTAARCPRAAARSARAKRAGHRSGRTPFTGRGSRAGRG
jgi:hypothetical protein